MKLRDCCFIVVAVIALVIGSSEVRQTSKTNAIEIQAVEPPPMPITALEVDEPQDVIKCECLCDDCVCDAVVQSTAVSPVSSCKGGTCGLQPVKIGKSNSNGRRVLNRKPVRSFFGRLFRR